MARNGQRTNYFYINQHKYINYYKYFEYNNIHNKGENISYKLYNLHKQIYKKKSYVTIFENISVSLFKYMGKVKLHFQNFFPRLYSYILLE